MSTKSIETAFVASATFTICSFVALALAFVAPAAADDCLKVVFGRYCLGGELDPDLEIRPGETVRVHDGLIAWVERRYEPGRSLRYHLLIQQLQAEYGTAINYDHFAERHRGRYEDLAVSIKQGYGLREWPMGGWVIRIVWASQEYMTLRYADVSLEGPAQKVDHAL